MKSKSESPKPEAAFCYPARVTSKGRIAIVGPGSLGRALAVSLRRSGYTIDTVVGRSRRKSLVRAKELAEQVGSHAANSLKGCDAEVIWFCVPDSAIAVAAHSAAKQIQWKGRIALHSSGALTSDELQELRTQGAAVASAHPLMTFVRSSQPSLHGIPFAIEGDSVAVRKARGVVRDLGADAYPIRKADKAAYHAWGTFASPLMTALLATTEQVAAAAGVSRKGAARRMTPILLQTIVNYAAFGAGNAFSGPFIRGDVATVKRHLEVLREIPTARAVYVALAEAALNLLPSQRRDELTKLLRSAMR